MADSRLSRAKTSAATTWRRLKAEHRWIEHVVEAWALLSRNNGNQYAAAVTYFSFLALFPLLLLAVAVVGYVLFFNPQLQRELFAHVTDSLPGSFGKTIKTSLQTAIDDRAGVGIVGVLGVLLTGLGWIGNLRQAIDAVWGKKVRKRNLVVSRAVNLLVLFGLGLGILVSLGLTAAGTSVTRQILDAVGLDTVPGATAVLKILGIAIAALGDMVIFWWLLLRLPDQHVPRRTALKGLVLAAIGFEILKIVGTYTIAHATASTTAGPFAAIIAILVWIQLVCRFMFFCCAWLATARTSKLTANTMPVVRAGEASGAAAGAVSPSTVGAALVGIGAVSGAVATWFAGRSGRSRQG